MYVKFCLEHRNERGQLEDISIDGRIISEEILRKEDGEFWTGFIWLRIGTSGELL
jgi:hypothetical protein